MIVHSAIPAASTLTTDRPELADLSLAAKVAAGCKESA